MFAGPLLLTLSSVVCQAPLREVPNRMESKGVSAFVRVCAVVDRNAELWICNITCLFRMIGGCVGRGAPEQFVFALSGHLHKLCEPERVASPLSSCCMTHTPTNPITPLASLHKIAMPHMNNQHTLPCEALSHTSKPHNHTTVAHTYVGAPAAEVA